MCQACPLLSRRPIPVEIRPLIHKRQLQTGYAFDETWCLPGPNPAAGRPRAGALLSRAPSHVAHAHPTDHAAQHVAGRLVESTRRSHTAPSPTNGRAPRPAQLSGCCRFKGQRARAVGPTGRTATSRHPHPHPPACPVDCAPQERNRQTASCTLTTGSGGQR